MQQRRVAEMDKISLAGDLGSGKSTVAGLLIDALGARYYSTGMIVRSIAERMGMTIGELNEYMETHPEIDREIDDGLVRLAESSESMIIDSRMAWHFTPGTFKVYLSTDPEVSALRIMNAHRQGESLGSLDDAVASTKARRSSECKRYLEQYGVDITDMANYSLIVDTTYASPDEVAEVIISAFSDWQADKSYKLCFLSPERLNYIDDEQDNGKVSQYAAMLDMGGEVPEVTVFERDGEFYIEDGHESALAYAFNFRTFVPARLVDAEIGTRKYVRMKNSL